MKYYITFNGSTYAKAACIDDISKLYISCIEITEEEFNQISSNKIPYFFDGTSWKTRPTFSCDTQVFLIEDEQYQLQLPTDYQKLLINGKETTETTVSFPEPGEYKIRIEPFPYLPVDVTFVIDRSLQKEQIRRIKELENDCNKYILAHYAYSRQNTFKAKFSQIIDELTNNYNNYTADQITQLQTAKNRLLEVNSWIESVLDYFYQKLDEIKNAPDLPTLDNITWDFSQFDSTDPQATIEEIRNLLQGILWA